MRRYGRFPRAPPAASEIRPSDATQGRQVVVKDQGHGAVTLQDRNSGPESHLQPAPPGGPLYSAGRREARAPAEGQPGQPDADSAA